MPDEWVRDRKAEFADAIPVGRMGTAEDIANAALYLASDESAYVVGTELVVDGGARSFERAHARFRLRHVIAAHPPIRPHVRHAWSHGGYFIRPSLVTLAAGPTCKEK